MIIKSNSLTIHIDSNNVPISSAMNLRYKKNRHKN